MPSLANKRTKDQIERDRAEVAKLYCQGIIQAEIGKRLRVSQQQISYDLKMIREQWKQSAIRDFDEMKAQELAKIDNLEVTYWLAWHRSCKNKEIEMSKMTEGKDGQRMEAQTRKEGQAGDPRFLQGIQWCIEKRCKLLGIDAPDKLELFGKDGGPIQFSEVVVELPNEG